METRDNSSPTLETDRPGDDAASQHGAAKSDKAAAERELHDARDRLSSAGRELRSEASGAAGAISSMVSEQAERRKEAAADHLSAFADAVRRAADDLGASDKSMSARLVQEAAHGVERLSSQLQSRSVSDMTRSVTSFGRENPTAFLAGCLLAGVAIGRLLTASSSRANNDRYGEDDDWQSGQRQAGGADYRWSPESRTEYPGSASSQGAGASAAGIPGAGLAAASGYGGAASGQAGTFDPTVAPSSAERAPGDLDAQGTMRDEDESGASTEVGWGGVSGREATGLGGGFAGEGDSDVSKPADRGLGKGGRDGDL